MRLSETIFQIEGLERADNMARGIADRFGYGTVLIALGMIGSAASILIKLWQKG